MKEIVEKIKDRVLSVNKIPPPMVYLFARNKEHLLMPLNYETDKDKEYCHMLVGELLRSGEFEGFCHVSDSFMVEKKKGDDISVQPRDDPDRVDVITITFKNEKGDGELFIIPYDTNNDKIIIDKKKIISKKLDNSNMSGRIWNMWK